ncbi:MAG: hypothetical protein K5898_12985 [Ruminococcus sp.]|uniref:dockerin type I domain-containing protein n=1 Tax=Ruminococcus sp. TaxID=41978 RepID=UPI0025E9FA4C|nr:dockerin type I domain-containing protein [Ruminococcus sp.]MCR4796053.1 hypothetical protein [Ruminococcus sp.]
MKKFISILSSAAIAAGMVSALAVNAADEAPSIYFTVDDKANGVETLKFGGIFVNTKENTSAIPCAMYIKDTSKKAGQIFVKATADESLKLTNLTGPIALYKGAPYKGFDTDDSMNLNVFENLNVVAVNYSNISSEKPMELNGENSDSYPLACFDAKFASDAAGGSYNLKVYSEGAYFSGIIARNGDGTFKEYDPSKNSKPLLINASDRKLGDINNDGKWDSVDVSGIMKEYTRQSAGKEGIFDGNQIAAADINGDGLVDAVDASNLLAYYAYLSGSGESSLNDFVKNRK